MLYLESKLFWVLQYKKSLLIILTAYLLMTKFVCKHRVHARLICVILLLIWGFTTWLVWCVMLMDIRWIPTGVQKGMSYNHIIICCWENRRSVILLQVLQGCMKWKMHAKSWLKLFIKYKFIWPHGPLFFGIKRLCEINRREGVP